MTLIHCLCKQTAARFSSQRCLNRRFKEYPQMCSRPETGTFNTAGNIMFDTYITNCRSVFLPISISRSLNKERNRLILTGGELCLVTFAVSPIVSETILHFELIQFRQAHSLLRNYFHVRRFLPPFSEKSITH